MALPNIMRRLFRNDGYGPLLKDEIIDRHISIQDWSSTYDYPVDTLVRGSNGLLYWSLAQSGPNAGGAQDPTTDDGTYWSAPSVKTMAAGDSSNASASTAWVNAWHSSLVLPSHLYVDAVNGDDGNSGFSAAAAKKNIETVENMLRNPLYLKPASVIIHVAAGTYNPIAANTDIIRGAFGVGIVYDFASGVVITGGIGLSGSGITVTMYGSLTISKAASANTIRVEANAFLRFGFNANGLSLTLNNISKSRAIFVSGGRISCEYSASSVSIKFTGTCSFSIGTVYVDSLGTFTCGYAGGSIAWSGSVSSPSSSKRYTVIHLSQLRSVGGTNVIPGPSSGGTVDSTSIFN